jgi:hypothetical protein
MKKAASLLLLLLFPSGALVLRAGEGTHRWFLEGSLAGALIDPGGLNARAEAQERQTAFNYRENFEWARRSAGGYFSYALEEPSGSGLPRIRSGFPVTLRVGRSVAPRVAVFAGLQFLTRGRSSTLHQDYEVSDRRPDQVSPGDYELSIAYPDFFVEAQAWLPQLGVRFDLLRRRSWTGGVRLAAGPMFASLRLIEERLYKRTESDGYWSESRYRLDMKGRGTGAAVEASGFLGLAISARLQLALECGYAYRTGARFSGPGTYESQRRDANATEDPTRSRWDEGDWRTQAAEAHQPWGDLYTTLPGNYFSDSQDKGNFRLDLSGWQLALVLRYAW